MKKNKPILCWSRTFVFDAPAEEVLPKLFQGLSAFLKDAKALGCEIKVGASIEEEEKDGE